MFIVVCLAGPVNKKLQRRIEIKTRRRTVTVRSFIFFRDWRQEVFERAEMKSILMLLAVAPQMIFGLKTPETTDNEKFQEPLTPSQSLYCNDLNPQSHLDFNMVNDAEKVARD